MTTWPGLRAAPPLEWMRVIRDGVPLTGARKVIAFSLALYARPDGTDAHPGWKRLAWESSSSKRTVAYAIRDLEGYGLVLCTEHASLSGIEGRANSYTLTLHDQLELITVSFEQWCKQNQVQPVAPGPRNTRCN